MKVFALAVLILALAVGAAGQAGHGPRRINGTVLSEDGVPIRGAKVIITLIESDAFQGRLPVTPKVKVRETAVFETKTDHKGHWAINGVSSSRWEVRASSPGCVDTVMTCDLTRISREPKVEIRLEKVKIGSYTADPELLGRANDLFGRGEYEKAGMLYELYLANDPGATRVLLILGDCRRKSGDLAAAVESYKKAVELASKHPRAKDDLGAALGKIGECCRDEGRPDQALVYMTRAADVLPDNATLRAELAEQLFSMGRAREAVPHFEAAIGVRPGDPLLHYGLGLAYVNLSEWARARDCLARVISIDPQSDLSNRSRDLLASIKDKRSARSLGPQVP